MRVLLSALLLTIAAAAQRPAIDPPTFLDSGVDGPTVMVVGGVHGDEPAGFRAARQIAGWTPVRGRLVVLPRANAPALEAGTRTADGGADLNRAFGDEDFASDPLAHALWSVVEEIAPDVLLDLHEGAGFAASGKSVGNSIQHAGTEVSARLAKLGCDAASEDLEDEQHQVVARPTLVAGSLARAAHQRLGADALLVIGHEQGKLATRTRRLRLAVHAMLVELGVVAHPPRVFEPNDERLLAVALFDDAGASGKGPGRLETLLDAEHGFVLRRVCGADVREGALSAFDVAIFPGGSGSGQAKALAEGGREAVREFVGGGGGYVGICAGAYLAANNYTWSLKITDADVIDREHWARGRGQVELEWATAQRGALGAPARGDVLYANGPLYAPSGDDQLPDFEVLAWYRGEIRKNEAPEGVMLDTPAVVSGRFGAGTVVCSSPHPEQTTGMDQVVRALVLRAAGAR